MTRTRPIASAAWFLLLMLWLLHGALGAPGESRAAMQRAGKAAAPAVQKKPAAATATPAPEEPRAAPPTRVLRTRTEQVASAPPPAPAAPSSRGMDFSIAGFGGWSIPLQQDLTVTDSDPTIGDNYTAKNLSLKHSPSLGLKATAWTSAVRDRLGIDLGLELDYMHFRPTLKEQDADATGSDVDSPVVGVTTSRTRLRAHLIALNVMVRWPLGVSPAFPHGRWYPYVGAGGGVQITRAIAAESGMSDTSTAALWQALAGVKFFVTRHVALFGEYKHTYADHAFTFGTSRQELTVQANHLLAGLAFHF
ncbi:outer membrane protein [Candidatus Nitrospira bockiana]